jgi:hypothetical protein
MTIFNQFWNSHARYGSIVLTIALDLALTIVQPQSCPAGAITDKGLMDAQKFHLVSLLFFYKSRAHYLPTQI